MEHSRRGLDPSRGCADSDLGAFDPGHDSPLLSAVDTKLESTQTLAHGKGSNLPVRDATLTRYGSETVVLSPAAEMLKVPATVLATYA